MIASAVIPAPNLRKIDSTGMRVPRITGLPPITSGLISTRSCGMCRLLRAGLDGAAGHHGDEVGAVFGTGVDVGVEAVILDRDVLDCIRGEGFRQSGFHLGHAEHGRSGAGYR